MSVLRSCAQTYEHDRRFTLYCPVRVNNALAGLGCTCLAVVTLVQFSAATLPIFLAHLLAMSWHTCSRACCRRLICLLGVIAWTAPMVWAHLLAMTCLALSVGLLHCFLTRSLAITCLASSLGLLPLVWAHLLAMTCLVSSLGLRQ